MRAILFLLTLAGFCPGMSVFIKDPATADSLGAGLTVLNATSPAFTRASSAYDPRTDTIVYVDQARTRTQVIGTTNYTAHLIEDAVTNILAFGTSGRFDFWTAANGLTVTADSAAAPNAEVIAQTLTDPGASLSSAQQTFTVANDSLSHTFSIYVLKTAGGTAPTFGITLALTGGTPVTTNARINTDTGAQQYGSNANTTVETSSAGTWYRAIVLITNNTSGNTTLTLDVYPAAAAYGASVDDATATGIAKVSFAMLAKTDFGSSFASNRNLLLNSERFGSTWAVTRATITSNSTADPLTGNTTADSLVEDATAANNHLVRQNFTKAASSQQFTFSVYLKQSGRTWAFAELTDSGLTNGCGMYFDVANGVKGTAVALGVGWTLDSSNIVSAASGWYRCDVTATTDTATTIRANIMSATGDLLAIHNGDSATALIVFGGQLVYGAKPQTYWSQQGAIGNRAVDSLISTGALSTTTGTLVAVMRPYGWTTNHMNAGITAGSTTLYSTVGTATDAISQIPRATPTQVQVRRVDAGGASANTVTISPLTHTNTVTNSTSMTWDSAAVKGYINGTYNAQGTVLTAPYNTTTAVQIGDQNGTTRAYCGYCLLLYKASVLPPSSEQIFGNGVTP